MSTCPPDPNSCPQPQEDPLVITDFFMPVGSTGIVFVTALPARLRANGTYVFKPEHTQLALWHAAADLGDMGLIGGQSFLFLREAVPWTITQTATFLGVTDPEVQAWENGTATLPRDIWFAMAVKLRQLAQEYGPNTMCIGPPDFRPRTIRITLPLWGLRPLGP